MFFRRGVGGDDRWLQAKLWIFSIGALLALVGMFLENDWLIGGAGLVLAAGLVLRFLDRGDADGGDAEEH
ncbi:MAG: hypothetical protein R6U63_14740 [Longimicrobiales bacterium]